MKHGNSLASQRRDRGLGQREKEAEEGLGADSASVLRVWITLSVKKWGDSEGFSLGM